MIIKLLLVVSFVLEQLVSTVNGVGNANAQCKTLNYQVYKDADSACVILDDTSSSAFSSNNGSLFCVPPPMPELIPIKEFPRMFKIGVALDWSYDYKYCDQLFMSYSLQENFRRRVPGYPEMSDDYAMYCWKHRSLGAITHLKAKLYMRAYPFDPAQWVLKGQFGPLFYRALYENSDQQKQANKLTVKNIQGFASYDETFKIAYFNFFLPSSMEDTDATVRLWRKNEPHKTDFEIGVDLVSACKDSISGQICETRKSPMVAKYLESYIPLIATSTDATIVSAVLKQNLLQLNLQWSSSELSQLTQQAVQGPEICRPKLIVIVYDSNPATISRGDRNDKVRSVMATFSHVLTWNSSASQVENSFNLYSDATEWDRMGREIRFLKGINDWTGGEQDAMLFYRDWTKETGLKIAITTCMCRSSPSIQDRNRGCRDYKHASLSLDPYWDS